MRSIALQVLLGLLGGVAVEGAPPADTLDDLAKLSTEARRQYVQTHSREELSALFARTSTESLIGAGKVLSQQFGTYEAHLIKSERISGKMLAPQSLTVHVRVKPLALRMDYLDGPGKGRRVLYDASQKKDELFAREGGFLGLVALWVGIDSSLAHGDSNHVVTELAFGAVVHTLESCFDKARPLGGYARKDEGLDAKGRYCTTFTAPKGGEHLYATRAHLCIDPVWAVPLLMEIDDARGPLERLEFDQLKAPVAADFSTDAI